MVFCVTYNFVSVLRGFSQTKTREPIERITLMKGGEMGSKVIYGMKTFKRKSKLTLFTVIGFIVFSLCNLS